MARRAPGVVALQRARWTVNWFKKGQVIEIECGEDIARAIEIYDKAQAAGRKGVTLRCANVGFPAPKRVTEAEAYKIVTKKVKGKKKRFKKKVIVNRMRELNAKGWFWCPFCIKFRKFEQPDLIWSPLLDDYVDNKERVFCCPMCGVTSKSWHVKMENPLIQTLEFRKRQKGKRRR